MKLPRTIIAILLLGLGAHLLSYAGSPDFVETGGATASPEPASRANLENLIKAKSQELEGVNQQLKTTQSNLQTTKNQRVTLQRELTAIVQNINQLGLHIQADEITTQKLGLEIDSLNYDIRDIEASIRNKTNTIAQLLRELQTKDESFLFILLKRGSLAESVLETQSLGNLKSKLSSDISNLNNLHGTLSGKVQTVGSKKSEIEKHRQNLVVRKEIVEDQKEERRVVLAQTKNKESLYQQQLSELQKQQEAIADEIDKIEAQLRATFDISQLPVKRPGVLAWPIALKSDGGKGIITQHFGERSYLYRNKPHNGLDIGVPIGTEVYAADDGTVMAADNNDRSRWSKYQYGKHVLIRHGNNLATLYAHLSQYAVQKGMSVKRGDLIGYSGNTGYSTGPHLHLGLYWAPSVVLQAVPPAAGLVPVGVIIDPQDYL